MLSCCLKFRKNTGNKNREVVRKKSRRILFLLKCAVCNSKNLLKSKKIVDY